MKVKAKTPIILTNNNIETFYIQINDFGTAL